MSDDLYRLELAISSREGLGTYEFEPVVADSRLFAKLADSRRSGNLTIVIGAGVSYPSGLETWEQLVKSAALKAIEGTAIPPAIVDKLSALQIPLPAQVRFFESVLGVKAAFRSHLTESLYATVNLDFSANPTLIAIAETVLGVDGGRAVLNVITYNFDNLLELAIAEVAKRHGCHTEIVSVYSPALYRSSAKDGCINLFHPHGFIPHGEPFGPYLEFPLVFSESNYHDHYLDLTYWANLIQLNAFERSTCLFMGLSFSDPNLRRLLDHAKRYGVSRSHVAISDITAASDPPYLREFIIDGDRRSLNIRPLWIESFDHLPNHIRAIK